MVIVLARAFGGPSYLAAFLFIAASVLVVAGYHTVPVRLRRTALFLFVFTLVLLPFATEPIAALQRGIFISGLLLAMISSVLLIAQCALRSPRVQQVGATLRAQAPQHRYPAFSVASHIFSGMLGMAGAHIMLVMAAPAQEANSEDKTDRVIAVTRAFGLAGFWSPIFGNMVTMLALYPGLTWAEVFPVGFFLAITALIVGAALNARDTKRNPRPIPPDQIVRSVRDLLLDGLPMLIPLGAFMALLLFTSKTLGIVTSAAVVLLAPITALTLHWAMGESGKRWQNVKTNIGESANSYPRVASEALVFMAAGCAGSIMAAAFPDSWAQAVASIAGVHSFVALMFLILVMLAFSLAGVHAVLTSVFLASTFTPALLHIPDLPHMAAILTGWCLSAIVTPYSVLSLTASRYSGNTLYQISVGRNWQFALISAVFSCVALMILNWLMH